MRSESLLSFYFLRMAEAAATLQKVIRKQLNKKPLDGINRYLLKACKNSEMVRKKSLELNFVGSSP